MSRLTNTNEAPTTSRSGRGETPSEAVVASKENNSHAANSSGFPASNLESYLQHKTLDEHFVSKEPKGSGQRSERESYMEQHAANNAENISKGLD